MDKSVELDDIGMRLRKVMVFIWRPALIILFVGVVVGPFQPGLAEQILTFAIWTIVLIPMLRSLAAAFFYWQKDMKKHSFAALVVVLVVIGVLAGNLSL